MTSYSVGLDLGDGESAVAWVGTTERSEPRVYERRPGESSVVTAIASTPARGTIIGEEALLHPEARYVQINFKEPPRRERSGIATTVRVVEFAQQLLIEFFDSHSDVAEDCHIYVGYPAGWSPRDVELYQQQLSDALRPFPLQMVAESQSAFIDVHDAEETRAGRRPALVIDVGSSTTDFTFVDEDTISNLPFGSALGSRQIDQDLADRVKSSVSASARNRLDEPTPNNLLLWLCRLKKEATYLGRRALPPIGLTGEMKWVVQTCWTLIDELDVAEIVDEVWRPRFLKELDGVWRYLDEKRPALVLTTGGGSRMQFISDDAARVFGSATVTGVEDPSLAVARGLASYGRWTARLSGFRRGIDDLVEELDVQQVLAATSRDLARQFYMSFYLVGWHRVIAKEIARIPPKKRVWTYPQLMHWYFQWLNSPEGEVERDNILSRLEAQLNERLRPEVVRLCTDFGIDPQALNIKISLPAGVMLRPVGRLMKAFDVLASLHGIFTQAQSRTRLGRVYLSRIASPFAQALEPVSWLLVRGYYFTNADLEDVARGVREEIKRQLSERARHIETLLI